MTLGELIQMLENEDPILVLPVGFNSPDSYRGYYDQLAFELANNISIGDMLEMARSCVGKVFQGYKGGDFKMDTWTEINYSQYGHTGEPISILLVRLMIANAKGEKVTQWEESDYWLNPDG